MPSYICKNCKSLTNGYYKIRKVATLNALLNGKYACTECNSTSLLPVQTPAAKMMMLKLGYNIEKVNTHPITAKEQQVNFSLWKILGIVFISSIIFIILVSNREMPSSSPTIKAAPVKSSGVPLLRPAYSGEPNDVARASLKETHSVCENLYGASRQPDGTIRALCSGVTPIKYFIATTIKDGVTYALVSNCDTNKQRGLPRCD